MDQVANSKTVFIIVPRLGTAGPEKGALALANLLSKKFQIVLLTFKRSEISHKQSFIHLDLFTKYKLEKASPHKIHSSLKCEITSLSKKENRILISLCFSADIHALALKRHFKFIVASVRGHLLQNYKSDLGLFGLILAIVHLISLSLFDFRIVMDSTMLRQLIFSRASRNFIIPNLVRQDIPESLGLTFQDPPLIRIAFVGSLTRRKNPLYLIDLALVLREKNISFEILVLGDGPLLEQLQAAIEFNLLQSFFDVRGHVFNPYELINSSTLIFHPSSSEGTSRSCLEALQLGIPCIVRESVANNYFIAEGYNGFLYSHTDQLPSLVLSAVSLRFKNQGKSLLRPAYSDDSILSSYVQLFSNNS